MTAEGTEYLDLDVTLRFKLKRGEWSLPETWDWQSLLDLNMDESVEVVGTVPPSTPQIQQGLTWFNDAIQFPRLIAELEAAGAFTEQVYQDLQDSMDLSEAEVTELIDRAQNTWDDIKENI